MSRNKNKYQELRGARIRDRRRRMAQRCRGEGFPGRIRENLEAAKVAGCPTPHKKAYDSEADAEETMMGFWRCPHPDKVLPSRVYECPCGRWHMTSTPRWDVPDTILHSGGSRVADQRMAA